jgi:hypothetical protein
MILTGFGISLTFNDRCSKSVATMQQTSADDYPSPGLTERDAQIEAENAARQQQRTAPKPKRRPGSRLPAVVRRKSPNAPGSSASTAGFSLPRGGVPGDVVISVDSEGCHRFFSLPPLRPMTSIALVGRESKRNQRR